MTQKHSRTNKRVLLKLSGEALGTSAGGIDPQILSSTISDIMCAYNQGTQIALVVGGGNIFRGAALQKAGLDRVAGDHMGMLATIMNGIALRDEIKRQGGKAILVSPHSVPSVTNQYIAEECREYLEQGNIVICSGGTGSPFFTTDTAAVLRAIELECDEVLKGTKVDGVYTADPKKDPNAVRFDKLSFDEVIQRKLEVMDLTAFALARDHDMSIRVFSMQKEGALTNAIANTTEGTLISSNGE